MVIKKVYDYEDLVRRNIEEAPSLDIPGLETTDFRVAPEGGHYMILQARITDSYRKKCTCIYCGSNKLRNEGYQALPRVIHDVPRANTRIDLVIFPPVLFCNECKQKFTLTKLPGVVEGRQMTERLEKYIRSECFLQPFSVLADLSGFQAVTIADMFDEELEKYEEYRKDHPLQAPRVLGIDEKHSGHKAHGTLVDVDNGLLLDMVETNDPEPMEAAVRKLVGWENIEVVTCDMHVPYHKWLKPLLPNALIVIDKFHVIKNVQDKVTKSKKALIEYRKKKILEIEDLEERARQLAILRHVTKSKRLFNYSIDSLSRMSETTQREYAQVIREFPEFALLHNYYHTVELMYAQLSYDDALRVWNDWFDILPPGDARSYKKWCEERGYPPECFAEFTSYKRAFFRNYKEYILNYFRPNARETNAATEGLNNLIGDILIKGKGYSFKRLRGKCLYASLIHERVTYNLNSRTIKRVKAGPVRDEKPVTKYEFSEKTTEISVPKLSVYSDNEWFLNTLAEPESMVWFGPDTGKPLVIIECIEGTIVRVPKEKVDHKHLAPYNSILQKRDPLT